MIYKWRYVESARILIGLLVSITTNADSENAIFMGCFRSDLTMR